MPLFRLVQKYPLVSLIVIYCCSSLCNADFVSFTYCYSIRNNSTLKNIPGYEKGGKITNIEVILLITSVYTTQYTTATVG